MIFFCANYDPVDVLGARGLGLWSRCDERNGADVTKEISRLSW